ncbi:trypsin-3-like [Topomyia yanbarensis]|uniref:trypsin-3-like n=1 Tax=Topomyia yanbarensis TaxID=2498891 RepID=UPI00273BF863|nr:trypsin-3-like [Topomyia yanbarensis]
MKTVVLLLNLAVTCFGAVPRADLRIVGGRDTTIEDHPYQVSLRRSGSHSCGGSILSANVILTAAHCVYYPNAEPSEFSVRAGSTFRNEGGQLVMISEIFVHPNYDDWTLDWDIAVLRLGQALTFGATIQPITLPNKSFQIEQGALASIAGWGGLYYQGPSTNRLQKVAVPIVRNVACRKAYANFGAILPFHLCAGSAGFDACQGDSGGPLVYKGQVIGIVSWGYGCAFNGYPTVYTRVSEFVDFIEEHL